MRPGLKGMNATDYDKIRNSGMFWEWYPEATGDFLDDTGGADEPIKAITDERGKNYGHPADHFQCTQDMFSCWEERRTQATDGEITDYDLEQPLRHIVYMICDKLTRAAQNPLHMDNFDDIQGYASLWDKCVNREKNNG